MQRRRRGHIARFSRAELGVRSGLALTALVLAYFSTTYSLAYMVRQTDPVRAHALAPESGRITALLAQKRFAEGPVSSERAPSVRLARLAVQQDPMAIPAVVTLGMVAQMRGDMARARRLFAFSQKLSRRDLQTQLWAVEDAVSRGNVTEALQHYDIALRGSKSAPALLFPVLSNAISDAAIRSALAATIGKRPPWAAAFVDHVAVNGDQPRAVAALFMDLRHTGIPVSPEAARTVIDRLVVANATMDAWRYYALEHPGAVMQRSRDPRFADNLKAPSLFDWKVVEDNGFATSIQRGEQNGIFDFSVPTGGGGVLLRQVQMLPPGAYRLQGHSINVEQPDSSLPYWSLTCADGRELGRVVVPPSTQANGLFVGRFNVPDGCAVQTLAFIARPSGEATGVTGQIDRVELAPLRITE